MDGKPGVDGKSGPQGPRGEQGPPGRLPSIEEVLPWIERIVEAWGEYQRRQTIEAEHRLLAEHQRIEAERALAETLQDNDTDDGGRKKKKKDKRHRRKDTDGE